MNSDLTIKNVKPYECCLCNESEEANYFDNKRMVDKQFCFNCNFWDERVEDYIRGESIVIRGLHYMDAGKKPNQDRGEFRGFGGRIFKIKMFNGKIIETNDLWHQGTIPELFKDKLKDNAEFMEYPTPVGHKQGFLG